MTSDESDEKVEQIGRAKLAIVHVGALFESDDTLLYDVLDAESGDLEALYSSTSTRRKTGSRTSSGAPLGSTSATSRSWRSIPPGKAATSSSQSSNV